MLLNESCWVLKPGGRLAVSYIGVSGAVPLAVQLVVELWAGCIAGALEESDYRLKLRGAGFEDIEIEPTRIYTAADAKTILAGNRDLERIAQAAQGKFASAFIRARKP